MIEEDGREIKILRDNMPFGQAGAGRVRHLLHRLQPLAAHHRADAREHVRRPAAGQLRPAAGLQPGRHRQSLLRAVRDIPRGSDDGRAAARPREPPAEAPQPIRRCPTVRSASAPSKETARHEQPASRARPDLRRGVGADRGRGVAHAQALPRRTPGRRCARARPARPSPPSAPATCATSRRPAKGIIARQREVKALVELRVPFELDRQAIDDVERGADEFGLAAGEGCRTTDRLCRGPRDLRGLRRGRHSRASARGPATRSMTLPADVRDYPDAIAQALSQLRLVGVNGPYSVLLGADAYTAARRDQRPGLSGAASTSSAWSTTRSSGPRPSPAPSC